MAEKRSSLTMIGCRIENCGVGINAHAGVDIQLERTTFARTGQAVVIRDGPTALSALGLPPDTPPQLVLEALQAISLAGSATLSAS